MLNLLFLATSLSVCSQKIPSDWLTGRIHQKIGQLNDYIPLMCDRNRSLYERNYYRLRALNLFAAKGEKYTLNDSIRQSLLFVKDNYSSKTNKRLVRDYFRGLVNLRYGPVTITGIKLAVSKEIPFGEDIRIVQPDTIDMATLTKVGGDIYVVPCILQYYETNNKVAVDLYCGWMDTIDGIELIPLLTDIWGVGKNE